MVFQIILIVIVVFAILFVLSIRGRHGEPNLAYFTSFFYAHRGYHNKDRGMPENSLIAFYAAAKNGFGAELDVHLTKDGQLVVMHDENIQRMTGVDANICDMTAQELEAFTLLDTQEPIPYLDEVLQIFEDANLPLVIELKTHKGNHKALAKATVEALANYPRLWYCIESFDPLAMRAIRKLNPSIIRGQLSTNFTREPEHLHFPLTFMLKHLMLNFLSQPDFVAYKHRYRFCPSLRLCKWLYGVQEFDWTIQKKVQVKRAAREGSVMIFEGLDPRAILNK